jgi:hypothetical protein
MMAISVGLCDYPLDIPRRGRKAVPGYLFGGPDGRRDATRLRKETDEKIARNRKRSGRSGRGSSGAVNLKILQRLPRSRSSAW